MKCYFCSEPEPICFDCMDNLLKTAREHLRVNADQAVIEAAFEWAKPIDINDDDEYERRNNKLIKAVEVHPDYKECS